MRMVVTVEIDCTLFWVFPQALWCFLPSVFLLSLLDLESTFVSNPLFCPDNDFCIEGSIESWIAEFIDSVIWVFKFLFSSSNFLDNWWAISSAVNLVVSTGISLLILSSEFNNVLKSSQFLTMSVLVPLDLETTSMFSFNSSSERFPE